MIARKLNYVNITFAAHMAVFGLVIFGILPRSVVPYWTILLAIFALWTPLEDSIAFFVRSIPFFIAIPITTEFDSFNMWRIMSGLIFLKWAWINKKEYEKFLNLKKLYKNRVAILLLTLLGLSILSITQAESFALAVKRVLYFINLSLIGIVIYNLIRKNAGFSERLIKNIAVPTIIVTLLGMIQLASVYFMDIFQFVDFWGGVVQRNLFGNLWADTAIKANTWFAYFGDQLSLRMFSIFPDSHSFPIFILLGLPAVMALALERVVKKSPEGLRAMLKTRASLLVVFVPFIFLAAILSGTRGIWVAGLLVTIISIVFIPWFKHSHTNDPSLFAIFKYTSSYIVIFFILFGLAYYIMATDQFQMTKGNTAILGKRVRSTIDISETSNARRIEIWKDSIKSIIKHPLLGVGIGNFPIVVDEDLAKAKAGSSAHNLYLHVAAETGIISLIIALWFLLTVIKKILSNFIATNDNLTKTYFAVAIVSIPWVLIYSLTDVALFDERAFLFFVTTVALTLGWQKT